MSDLMKQLQKPFKAEDIEWRVQRAMKTARGPKAVVLAYVTNRAIMNRLDEVFGVGGWKNEYREWREKGVMCGLSVKIDDEWVTKWDAAEETNIESTKGGFSGAMKRTAVQFGIGRYLYNLDEYWVDIKDKGRHYIRSGKGNDEIKGYWDPPQLPSWALPKLETVDGVKPSEKLMDNIKTTAAELAELRNTDPATVFESMNIKNLSQLNKEQAEKALAVLEKWFKQAQEKIMNEQK
ncbi:Rad52/Rad22 family DNA repair protein [Bacillus sp. FSL W8-1122]